MLYVVQRAVSAVWKEYKAENGKPYYHNTLTGKTQWETPAELLGMIAFLCCILVIVSFFLCLCAVCVCVFVYSFVCLSAVLGVAAQQSLIDAPPPAAPNAFYTQPVATAAVPAAAVVSAASAAAAAVNGESTEQQTQPRTYKNKAEAQAAFRGLLAELVWRTVFFFDMFSCLYD